MPILLALLCLALAACRDIDAAGRARVLDVELDGFTLRFDPPILAVPERRLPWIADAAERAAFAHSRALVVPFSARNDSPIPRTLSLGFDLVTRDGAHHTGWTFNARIWASRHGRVALLDAGRLDPSGRLDSVLVFPVDPTRLAGAELHVSRGLPARDRAHRRPRAVRERAIVALSPAVAGEPIEPR